MSAPASVFCFIQYQGINGEGFGHVSVLWKMFMLFLIKAWEPGIYQQSQLSHIQGIQANVWTERMHTIKRLDFMTFPRLCALAEAA